MVAALICWRPWLEQLASAGVTTVGSMQEPGLTTPLELIRQRAVVAEERVIIGAAITVLGATAATGVGFA